MRISLAFTKNKYLSTKLLSFVAIPLIVGCFQLEATNDKRSDTKCQSTAKAPSSQTSMKTSGVIDLPPNWPEQNVLLGLSWTAPADGEAILQYGQSLTNYYNYRYMDLTFMSEAQAIGAISEMQSSAVNYPGTAKSSVVMQLFLDGTIAAANESQKKDLLLAKMNNPTEVAKYFQLFSKMATPVNSESKSVVILEPNLWAYLLQARFHLENTPAPNAVAAGLVDGDENYSNLLNFPAAVKFNTLVAADPSLDINTFGYLEEYPNTVAGLARAMIRAAKELLPNATIVGHTSNWAVFADGCSGVGQPSANANDLISGAIDSKGSKSLVTWNDQDIQLSAFSQVKFLRELYGWGSEYHSKNWPDAFAVEKGALDAGLVLYGPAQGYYTSTKPGAGTDAFFWDQAKNDKFMSWSKNISHGIQLPLIAFRIPTGNGSLTQNTAFHYQDTFMDWLFSSNNWQTPLPNSTSIPTWSPNNLATFKNAGFVGLFTGRDGWPAVGTHPGSRSSSSATGGPSVAISGDGGFAITSYLNSDMSFTPVAVDFDEVAFEAASGSCDAKEVTLDVDPELDLDPELEACPELPHFDFDD